jgi:hypothetical protein
MLSLSGVLYSLPVRMMPSLPEGLAGVPAGVVPSLSFCSLPAWGRLQKEEVG